MMKQILGIVVLGFLLSGCFAPDQPFNVSAPKTQNHSEIISKASSGQIPVKIHQRNSNRIDIIRWAEATTTRPWPRITNYPNWIETAVNHCSSYKKKTYYMYKDKAPKNLWKGTLLPFGKSSFGLVQYIKGNPTWYHTETFVCANSKDQAINVAYNLKFDDAGYKNKYLKEHPGEWVIKEWNIKKSKKELEIAKKKQQNEIEKEKLAQIFGPECEKQKLIKGTSDYNQCLDNKITLELERQKVLEKKLASMKPKERHAYNCSETFKFKKGTDKFNDCVFKLYTAELDLQKLELEKKVAEARIEAAATEQAKAEALARAQIASAKAAQRSSDLNNSIQLMKLGSSMLGGSTSSSSSNSFDINNRTRTTCRVVGGFLNCY